MGSGKNCGMPKLNREILIDFQNKNIYILLNLEDFFKKITNNFENIGFLKGNMANKAQVYSQTNYTIHEYKYKIGQNLTEHIKQILMKAELESPVSQSFRTILPGV